MIRKILLGVFVLVQFGLVAQIHLDETDSLALSLRTQEYFLKGKDTIEGIDSGEFMPPNPLPTIPLPADCLGLTSEQAKKCLNAYFKNIIKQEIKIPDELSDSVFYEKIYVRFIVDESARITDMEAVNEPKDMSAIRSKRRSILLTEAKRVLGFAKFVKAPYIGNKPCKMVLTIPIQFSNPGQKQSNEE